MKLLPTDEGVHHYDSSLLSADTLYIQDDEQVLDDLSDLVSHPPDPHMELLSAQGCTGKFVMAAFKHS